MSPVYEYRCRRCEATKEIVAKMGEAPDTLEIPCLAPLLTMEPSEPPECEFERILSPFTGKVKDGTPTFHQRAPRK